MSIGQPEDVSGGDEGVLRRLIEPGEGPAPCFVRGSKVTLEFVARRANGTIIDSTYTLNQGPVELVLGKDFCVAVWELAVSTMLIGELSRFFCQPKYTRGFAQFLTVMRQHRRARALGHTIGCVHGVHSQCGAEASQMGEDYADLAALQGQPIDFEFRLLKVEPADPLTDTWLLSHEEKLKRAMELREIGKQQFHGALFHDALASFQRAVNLADEASVHERHGPTTQVNDEVIIPCLLNMAACCLKLSRWQLAIDSCTRALTIRPDIAKALFRRASALIHRGWDLDVAERDLNTLRSLDSSIDLTNEWVLLRQQRASSAVTERNMYTKLFSENT